MNNRLNRLIAVLTVAASVLAPSLPALADDVILLPVNSTLTGYEGSPGGTYRVTTDSNYWSAVWIKPVPTSWVNYDMTVRESATGLTLANSNYRSFPDWRMVDFVGVNGNIRPAGSYDAQVFRVNGSTGTYQIGFRQENKMLLPMSMTQPIYAVQTDEQNMIIRDVYIPAGQCLGVRIWNYANSFGVIGVLPADQAVANVRDEDSQVYGQSVPTPSVTLRYTAKVSGWHAFILTNQPWGSSPFASLPRYQRVHC